MQNFMTTGLLISHINKINLHKKTLLNPTVYHEKYKKYRNVYNCVVKASKQMFLDSNFKKYQKTSEKKTGNFVGGSLRESEEGTKRNTKINLIKIT